MRKGKPDGFPFLIPPISCLSRSQVAQQPRVIAAVQDIRLALQGDGSCVDEEHLIGDELGIVLGTTGRDHQLVSPSLWRQSAAQVAQQPGVIAAVQDIRLALQGDASPRR